MVKIMRQVLSIGFSLLGVLCVICIGNYISWYYQARAEADYWYHEFEVILACKNDTRACVTVASLDEFNRYSVDRKLQVVAVHALEAELALPWSRKQRVIKCIQVFFALKAQSATPTKNIRKLEVSTIV